MRPPLTPPISHRWSMSDGCVLHGRVWPTRAANPAIGCLYIHGIQSHGGWFEWSASLLAERLGPVLLADRRGSGLNQAARGDTPGVDRWLRDLDELADWAGVELGVRRFAVVGVSWGGKLAALWAHRRSQLIERLLLIAPGIFPRVDLSTSAKLRVGWALISDPQRQFEIPLSDPALFTDSARARRFIADDPLRLTQATARFLWCSRRVDRMVRGWGRGVVGVPITLFLAGRDRIIRNVPTERWACHVGSAGVWLRVFPHASHTLEFEPQVEELAEELGQWAAGARR